MIKKKKKSEEEFEPHSRETDEWNDHLEAIRYTTKVFSEVSKNITSDLVLADLLEHQKEFIREQIKQSMAMKGLIPNEDIAARIEGKMIAESILISVLNRNLSSNTLLKIIGNINRENPPEEYGPTLAEQKPSLYDKAKENISKVNPFG